MQNTFVTKFAGVSQCNLHVTELRINEGNAFSKSAFMSQCCRTANKDSICWFKQDQSCLICAEAA